MMLHAIDTRGWETAKAWCVPTVVSLLSGVPLIHSHSRAAFVQDKSLKDVEGVYASEALMLLREQGMKGEQIKLSERYSDAPTLRMFLKERTPYETCMPLMIQIEDKKDFCHMISCWQNFCADNWTMKIVRVKDFPHLKRYVTSAWVISKL